MSSCVKTLSNNKQLFKIQDYFTMPKFNLLRKVDRNISNDNTIDKMKEFESLSHSINSLMRKKKNIENFLEDPESFNSVSLHILGDHKLGFQEELNSNDIIGVLSNKLESIEEELSFEKNKLKNLL